MPIEIKRPNPKPVDRINVYDRSSSSYGHYSISFRENGSNRVSVGWSGCADRFDITVNEVRDLASALLEMVGDR